MLQGLAANIDIGIFMVYHFQNYVIARHAVELNNRTLSVTPGEPTNFSINISYLNTLEILHNVTLRIVFTYTDKLTKKLLPPQKFYIIPSWNVIHYRRFG